MASMSSAAIPMIMSAAQQGMSAIAKSNEQNAATAAQNAQIEQQNQIWLDQQARQERQQRDLLKQQQASARAALAAGGTGMDGGSGAALLAGLAKKTEQKITDDYADIYERSLQQSSKYSKPNTSSAASALSQGLSAFNIFKST